MAPISIFDLSSYILSSDELFEKLPGTLYDVDVKFRLDKRAVPVQ